MLENNSSDDRSYHVEQEVPVAPPSLPILTVSAHSSSPGSLVNVDLNQLPDSAIHEESRWDSFLQHFSQRRAAGQQVHDYTLFTAIAPCSLPPDLQTST